MSNVSAAILQSSSGTNEHNCSFELQTLAWLTPLFLTAKKLAFKFSLYVFEYRPLPPYIHLASTHVMNAPRPSLF